MGGSDWNSIIANALGAPTAGNILCGDINASTSLFLTVPANATWRGSVTLAVSASANSGSVASSIPTIYTSSGTGTTPSNQNICRVQLVATSSFNGSVAVSQTVPNVVIVAGSSAAGLQMSFGTGGFATVAPTAIAIGQLL